MSRSSNNDEVDISWALDLAPSAQSIDGDRESSCVGDYTRAEEAMLLFAKDIFLTIMSKVGSFKLLVSHVQAPYDLRISDGFIVTAIEFLGGEIIELEDPYSFPDDLKASIHDQGQSPDVLIISDFLKSKCVTDEEFRYLIELFSRTFDLLNFAPQKFIHFE